MRTPGGDGAAVSGGGGAGNGPVRDAPGHQLQIDFGQRRIAIEGEDAGKVFLFVATLG
jgi:hypothetical protein